MEDLYSDLENYQYDNIVSELKTENQELKCKLEEYASTLGSLQKDFDKLSAEYKKLEVNYSSLLKTARAEIERKSQMITNLNKEKDKLVIDAMQKRGRMQNRKNNLSNKQQMGKQLPKEDLPKNEKDAPDITDNISGTLHQQKKEKQDKTICSLGPDLKDNSNIKEKEQKSKNDQNKYKEKNQNEIKKRKENHSGLELMESDGYATSTNYTAVSLDPNVKDNYNVEENELKSKKFEEYKDREKNKNEINKSKKNHSDVLNSGEVTTVNQKTISLGSTLKDKPDFEESELKSMKFDAYTERGKNKNDIETGTDIYSDIFNKDDDINIDLPTISIGTNLKDKPDVKENECKFNKIDASRDRENNKNEWKKSKVPSDVFSNSVYTNTVSKIRNRRKSMPLMNRGDFQLSSDEDQDDIPRDHRFRRKSPLRDDRIYHDKYRDYDRNNLERKVPDLIRMGDRHTSNIKQSSRDIYHKSNTGYRDGDRHKSRDNRDKYEPSQRFRRYYSPDRPYNIYGEYYNKHRDTNDRPYKFDNVRNRTLVSPPPDNYNHNQRSREFDGQRFQREVVNPMKHKLNDVLEEPICKRLRSESINKPLDKHLFAHDRDVESRAHSLSRPLELSYLQSPDYVHSENEQQIKEIRSTSDTKLDDPRLKSKKYVVNTHSDKVVLSTVVGRNVDVKAIDKTKWNKHKDKNVYEMPALLKERPPISEDLVKDIYTDIDNPISNLSLESGEICAEEEMGIGSENAGKGTVNTIHNSNNKNVHNDVRPQDQIEINKKEKELAYTAHNEQSCTTVLSKNYRIPKTKKSDTPKELEQDSTRNKNKRDSTKQAHKKRNIKDKRESEKKLKPDSNNCNSSKKSSDTMDVCKNKKLINFKHREHSPEIPIISARDTVEGDLELSDETCDYDVPEQTKYDEGNKAKPGESNKNIVIDNIKKDLNIGEPEKSECTLFKERVERPCENKHFNILHGGNEVQPKDLISNTDKEQKSKDIKNKLCDLFGDTSSLITLDDLGIAPSTTKGNLNEYAPIFENTQDALDLNIEEMEKVQTRAMKSNRDKDEPIIKDANKNITSENTENPSKRENKKSNKNVEKSSSLQHVFDNVNREPGDNTVVKTVIISTGIQNACHPGETVRDVKQEKQHPTIERKTNDNAPISPALLSIKALATSTPYKPQNETALSVPETSCSSSNSTRGKEVEKNSKVAPSNLDIPDVRIMVKRRRKAKGGAPS